MMIDNTISKLHAAIAAVCPIDGVSVGRKADKATWRIDFKAEATDAQKDAARAAMEGFDFAVAKAAQDAERAREERIQSRMRQLAEAMENDPTLFDRMTRARA